MNTNLAQPLTARLILALVSLAGPVSLGQPTMATLPPSPATRGLPLTASMATQTNDPQATLRQDVDKLGNRLDSLKDTVDKAFSASSSQAQAVASTASNYMFWGTWILGGVTILFGGLSIWQFVDVKAGKKEIEVLRKEMEQHVGGVEDLRRRIAQEVKNLEEHNADLVHKLAQLESGARLLTHMEQVAASHQPPNQIKREIVALLLRNHDWQESFRNEIVEHLRAWNADAGLAQTLPDKGESVTEAQADTQKSIEH